MPSRAADPMVVDPFMKVMVPVGTGPEPPITVATRMVAGSCPGVVPVPRLVTVDIAWTAWVRVVDVLALSFVSPA